MNTCVIALCCLAMLTSFGQAQTTTPADPPKSVRIFGRLVYPDGRPVSHQVQMMAEIVPAGLRDRKDVRTDDSGVFTFFGRPGAKYSIYLGAEWKTPPKIVDTASGMDVDVGDMVLERCPPQDVYPISKEKTAGQLIGDLNLEQILIEPQQPQPQNGKPVGYPAVPLHKPSESTNHSASPPYFNEFPPCWSGPSLDRREEWEWRTDVNFYRPVRVESFLGGKVRWIRVVRYDPKLTPSQIREEVQKTWLGEFSGASNSINWDEGSDWNIDASVEYEDGRRGSIVTDGSHVQIEDREGKYWYLRLLPAAQ